MLVNGFLASRRPWRREVFSAELPDEPARGPTGSPDEDGTRDMLRRALAQLPPSQRTIVVLRYWEDLSVERTAAILGCSPGNVKSQAARGLAHLRGALGGRRGRRRTAMTNPHTPDVADDAARRHRGHGLHGVGRPEVAADHPRRPVGRGAPGPRRPVIPRRSASPTRLTDPFPPWPTPGEPSSSGPATGARGGGGRVRARRPGADRARSGRPGPHGGPPAPAEGGQVCASGRRSKAMSRIGEEWVSAPTDR